jgi:hypothetical protein
MSTARQRLGTQVSAATNMQATIEELLGMMFSVRSILSGHKGRELLNWSSVGRWTVKRRLYVCYRTTISEVCNSVRLLQFLCSSPLPGNRQW